MWLYGPWRAGAGQPSAILILPMEVRGQAEGADYVGRAVAETIAVTLAKWKGLEVLPVPPLGQMAEAGTQEQTRQARGLGAGILLAGAVSRDGSRVEASVSLVDTVRNRVLWGTRRSEAGGDLDALASSLAEDLASHLNLVSKELYGDFGEIFGGPDMSASPELADVLTAYRSHDWHAGEEAARRLIGRFPDEPEA